MKTFATTGKNKVTQSERLIFVNLSQRASGRLSCCCGLALAPPPTTMPLIRRLRQRLATDEKITPISRLLICARVWPSKNNNKARRAPRQSRNAPIESAERLGVRARARETKRRKRNRGRKTFFGSLDDATILARRLAGWPRGSGAAVTIIYASLCTFSKSSTGPGGKTVAAICCCASSRRTCSMVRRLRATR